MAKTIGKKPSLVKKSVRAAAPARGKPRKAPAISIKAAVKPTKKPAAKPAAAKPTSRVPFKTASKPAPVVKTVSKGKNGRVLKTRPPLTRAMPRVEVKTPIAALAPVAVIAPAPLIPNGKGRKNQAGFSNRELEHFRELLLDKRRELIGDMHSMEHEALRTSGGSNLSNLPIHMADMGTDNYEQEFTLGLVQKDRDLLKEINLALAKIPGGTYGLCEGTGQPILKERLEYQPWARYSVEHQRKMERHGR